MAQIIFSDVDGCLLGQGANCFTQIKKAIQGISKSQVLILATGKTADELIHLNHTLELSGPFIVENGQGLLFKSPLPPVLPCSKSSILGEYSLFPLGEIMPDKSFLKSISPPNTLLTEMEEDELASLTGMSTEDAYRAKKRFFTEPIFIKHLSPNALKILKKQVRNKTLYYSQTSRFLHVTKSFSNKGRAVRFLLQKLYFEEPNTTYAIGDSLNDFSMFAQCEKNYYISNQPYDFLPKGCEIILEKELAGWLRIVSQIWV